jgi:hypothetical protein
MGFLDKIRALLRGTAENPDVAAGFSACAFVESLGSGIMHPSVASVVSFHDDECRAMDSDLPLA